MIVVLMTSRSGSSLVCGILAAHGLKWSDGKNDPMGAGGGKPIYRAFENTTIKRTMAKIPNGKSPRGDIVPVTNTAIDIMKKVMATQDVDFVKSSAEYVDIWQAWSECVRVPVHFIKVYRPPEDILESWYRRNKGDRADAEKVIRKRMKIMDDVEGRFIATNMLMDYEDWGMSGIKDAFKYCGVEFDPYLADAVIKPEVFTT